MLWTRLLLGSNPSSIFNHACGYRRRGCLVFSCFMFSGATMKLPGLLLPLTLCLTGCHSFTRAPGAVGQIIDAESRAPISGARITRPFIPSGGIGIPAEGIPVTVVLSDRRGRFDLPPARHTQFAFMHLRNPESISGSFTVSSDGYGTNQVQGVASSHTLWRVNCGQIPLKTK